VPPRQTPVLSSQPNNAHHRRGLHRDPEEPGNSVAFRTGGGRPDRRCRPIAAEGPSVIQLPVRSSVEPLRCANSPDRDQMGTPVSAR